MTGPLPKPRLNWRQDWFLWEGGIVTAGVFWSAEQMHAYAEAEIARAMGAALVAAADLRAKDDQRGGAANDLGLEGTTGAADLMLANSDRATLMAECQALRELHHDEDMLVKRVAELERENAALRLEVTALELLVKMRPAPMADMVKVEDVAMRFVRGAQGMTHDECEWFIEWTEPIIAKALDQVSTASTLTQAAT